MGQRREASESSAIFNYPGGGNLLPSGAGRFQSVPIEMKAAVEGKQDVGDQ